MLKKPSPTFHYNRPVSQEEQKRVVINLYESGIAEEFIALQLDIEILSVISILKEYIIFTKEIPNNKQTNYTIILTNSSLLWSNDRLTILKQNIQFLKYTFLS
jgi:hypothetical protein